MKKLLKTITSFAMIFSILICLTSCGGNVVASAWVKLSADGYIIYTSNMYASSGEHIYLYENEAEAENDTNKVNYSLSITFYPRALGTDTINSERTIVVDISSYREMQVRINKNKSIYNSTKKVYLNGVELTYSNIHESEYYLTLTYSDVAFVRGNPNGKINGVINTIEYK